MEETEQKAPRNWIPERSWKNYNKYREISQLHTEVTEATSSRIKLGRSRRIEKEPLKKQKHVLQ